MKLLKMQHFDFCAFTLEMLMTYTKNKLMVLQILLLCPASLWRKASVPLVIDNLKLIIEILAMSLLAIALNQCPY